MSNEHKLARKYRPTSVHSTRGTTYTESTPPSTEHHPRRPSSVKLNPPPSLHFTLMNDNDPHDPVDPWTSSYHHSHSHPSSPHISRRSSAGVASNDTGRSNGQFSCVSIPSSSGAPQYLNPRTFMYPRRQSLSRPRSSQSISDASSSQRPGAMSAYPLSVSHSHRSSVGIASAVGISQMDAIESQPKPGYFDLATFDYAQRARPLSTPPITPEPALYRQLSMESMNSTDSVPFAPPPPPPPSLWKNFTCHFTKRVIKRHIKFMLALYISSILILIPKVSIAQGTLPFLSNIAVVFMHPARTIGSQLEVTVFSVIGALFAAAWIFPCQLSVVAYNQRYLMQGGNAGWVIQATWFFVGIWIMTTFKIRYPKLNGTFIIYTVIGTFAVTQSHRILTYTFRDFLNPMAPLMIGVGITLLVSIICWPETASEELGRALNESMDTSRALLNLSTRYFLLNHKTIALPKSVIEKAQAEVREAQKKLYGAYQEARYEVTYSMRNPADYKEVRAVVSALMRHLASMSLVVQNERLMMLGHPDRDDTDLLSQREGSITSLISDDDTGSDSDNSREDSVCNDKEGAFTNGGQNHRQSKKASCSGGPGERLQRRSRADEIRRVRQLFMRAEKSTEEIMKARQQRAQSAFQFDRSGLISAPSPSSGSHDKNAAGVTNFFKERRRSRLSLGVNLVGINTSEGALEASNEERNYNTTRSLKSLFSTKSSTKFKSDPSSFQAGVQSTGVDTGKGKAVCRNRSEGSLFGESIAMAEFTSEAGPSNRPSPGYPGIPTTEKRYAPSVGRSLTEHQVQEAAMALRRQKRKQLRLAQKRAEAVERAAKTEKTKTEKHEQTEAAAAAAARTVPPKEVAFGDRKLFMSFLSIVRDPIQRLSDSCSRVMLTMERELASGLNVESDRIERIKRRNAARTDAVRNAEAVGKTNGSGLSSRKGSMKANDKSSEPTVAPVGGPLQASDRTQQSEDPWSRVRVLMGIKKPVMAQEEIEYTEALKVALDKGKRVKSAKGGLNSDAIHPRKLQRDPTRVAASSFDEDDSDSLMLPQGMSSVQYMIQEVEMFDKAEATGLQEFVENHPTLEIGPREEIFLIFFFLFALREIARELLRLAKFIEELEDREWKQMQEEHRTKRKKQLWWPKVIGNFWRWISWGSVSQLKTSEGYASAMMISTKNMERSELRSVQQERERVEAKAKTARLAAELAVLELAKAADQKEKRRRESEMWDPPPPRRSVTISAIFHRGRDHQHDVEKGQQVQHPTRSSTTPSHGILRNCEPSHPLHSNSESQDGRHIVSPDLNSALPSVEVASEGQHNSNSEPTSIKAAVNNNTPSRAQQYTVVEIPSYNELRHTGTVYHSKYSISLSSNVPDVRRHDTAPTESSQQRQSTMASLVAQEPNALPNSTAPAHSSEAESPFSLPPRPDSPSSLEASDSPSSDSEEFPTTARTRSKSAFVMFGRKHESKETRDDFHSLALEKEHKIHQAIREAEAAEPVQRTLFINIPKPKSWRYRVWEGLQPFKSDEVKFGFKMAAALTFIGLWSWLDWDNEYLASDRGQWAMTTVMAVLSPTIGATFSVCAMRIGGTMIGSSWALLTYIALPRNPYVILAMLLILAFAVAFLILESKHPLIGVIMMLSYSSVIFINYLGNTNETIVHLFYKQAITVIEGILIAVVVNSLLWPMLARRELRKEIALLIGHQGVLFAELINKFLLEHQVREVESTVEESGGQSESQNSQSRHGSREPSANTTEPLQVVETPLKGSGPRKVHNSGQKHALDDEFQNANDPDRLAFQYVEHQLQTKLIKISQLLELSASEPRLKEKFPMKLYKQIVQCCQNILDRMVSMRMAAQLLSPEVRDLVTGPMNYYRRDMVGALLLYFSVLSSSLASKTPLPPYLPSARMARLRVIYNVRIAISEHQAATSQNHYTYIYYYAFSSALEEVIEELELLAILIKPIVGITLVTSGDAYAYGFRGNQINDQPEQYGMPPQSYHRQDPRNDKSGMFEPSSSMSGFSGANSGGCASGPIFGSGTLSPPRILVQPMNNVHPDLLLEHGGQGGFIPNSTSLQPQTGTTSTACQTVPADTAFTRSMGYIPGLDSMQMPFSTATGSPTRTSKNLNMAVPVPVIFSHPTIPASSVIVMDENLLENRHGQRFKDAILVAQEASGQQVIEVSTPVLQAAAAAVSQAPEMDIGSLQTGLSAESPLISGKVLPSGTFSSITGGGESSLRKKISLRLAGAKEKLHSRGTEGNDETQSASDQEGLRLNTEHRSPQEVHVVEPPLPEGHGDIAKMEQVFVDATRLEASPRSEDQEQTRETGEDPLDAVALPPSAVASPKLQSPGHR